MQYRGGGDLAIKGLTQVFVRAHDATSNLPKKGRAKDGFLNESTWKHVKIDGECTRMQRLTYEF